MALGVLAVVACTSATALETPERSAALQQSVWTYRDSVPAAITDMAQSEDGAIWVGTDSGLYRFDAQTFQQVRLPGATDTGLSYVHRLFASSRGGLWVGMLPGMVAFMKDGKSRLYDERDGLPAGDALAFAQQADGTMWVGTSQGLARLRGERWEIVDATWHWSGGPAMTLMVDSTDRLWIRSGDKVFTLSSAEHRVTSYPNAPCGGCGLNFLESSAGVVYLARPDGLERLAVNAPSGQSRWSTPTSVLLDGKDTLWIRSSQSSLRSASLDGATAEPTKTGTSLLRFEQGDSHLPGWGELLFRDRDGNLWSKTRSGLIRFGPKNFHPIMTMSNWPEIGREVQWLMAPQPHGELLFTDGSESNVFVSDGGPLRRRQLPEIVATVAPGQDGAAWAAGFHWLWRLRAEQREQFDIPAAAHVPEFPIYVLSQDRNGGLWASDAVGKTSRFFEGRWAAKGGIRALPDGGAYAMTSDRSGRVWFAFRGRVLDMLDGETVRAFGVEDGLHVERVLSMYGQRGSVWIGGSAGVARYDGQRFQMLVTSDPGALRDVSGIVETETGDLWLNARQGLVRLSASELARAAARPGTPLLAEVFGAADGLSGETHGPCPRPSLVEGDDGRLWAGTSEGIYWFDPRLIARTPVRAAVLQKLVVDDRPFTVEGPQRLPVGAKALKFSFGGGNLSAADKLQYRYRTDGVDDDWHPAPSQREAYYMNLGPGQYRFRVQVTRAGLPWPATETALDFEIPPAFVQTRLFRVLCATLAALAIWLLVQWRSRQLAKPLRIRFEARLAERVRIARDLHDTLLQSMQGLVLYLQGMAMKLGRDHPMRRELEQVLQIGNEGLQEGRDRILGLRFQEGMSDSLSESLSTVGEQLRMLNGGCRFVLDVRGTPVPLRVGVHEEVHGVAREAIANAFRHAQATTISVCLDFAASALVTTIRDDGRGIDPEIAAGKRLTGHWGLNGMSERARQIGASLTIQGMLGEGTVVELLVPAARAYVRSAGWLFGRRLRGASR